MASTRTDRIPVLQQIEKSRSSVVVSIVTGDRENLAYQLEPSIVRVVYDVLSQRWQSQNAARLDVFLYSRGGHGDVPWALMSMLREVAKDKEISFLVPYHAHSAATIAALGADYIIMGPKGELGPIDTTMFSPYSPIHPKTGMPLPISVEDVMGYFSLLEGIGCNGPDTKIQGLQAFVQQTQPAPIHPYALGIVQRLHDQTKLVANQLLASRLNPFPESENAAIVDAVAKKINSHNHAISRTEALRTIGLRSVVKAEDQGLDQVIWDLLLKYEDELSIRVPFSPEDDFRSNRNLDEKEYTGLPIAFVETIDSCQVCKLDVALRRQRQQIQSVSVQPQIQLPPIYVGPGIDLAQIQAMLQGWMNTVLPGMLQAIINNAVQNAIRSTPTVGFQREEFHKHWEEVLPHPPQPAAQPVAQPAAPSPQPGFPFLPPGASPQTGHPGGQPIILHPGAQPFPFPLGALFGHPGAQFIIPQPQPGVQPSQPPASQPVIQPSHPQPPGAQPPQLPGSQPAIQSPQPQPGTQSPDLQLGVQPPEPFEPQQDAPPPQPVPQPPELEQGAQPPQPPEPQQVSPPQVVQQSPDVQPGVQPPSDAQPVNPPLSQPETDLPSDNS